MARLVPIPFVGELEENDPRLVVFEGVPYCVVKSGGAVRAFVAACSHEDRAIVPLRSKKGFIPCPHHGATFSPVTGEVEDDRGNDCPSGMKEVAIETTLDGVPALRARRRHRKLLSKKERRRVSKLA